MPWQNQCSDQIKTVVGTTKIRHPTTPPEIITSNQKTDIHPGRALLQGEGETSRATTGTTKNKLSKLW